MPNYKELYFKLFRASEDALNLLITAQQECEELYLASGEPELQIAPPLGGKKSVEEG